MYEINQFFFYKVVVLIEILVAQFLFLMNMEKRSHFIIRFILIHLLMIGVSFAIPVFSHDGWFIALVFIFLYVLTLLGQFFLYDVKFINLIYLTSAGYILQHLSYAIIQLTLLLSGLSGGLNLGIYGDGTAQNFNIFSLIIYFEVIIITYLLTYFLFARKIKESDFYIDKKWILFLCIIFSFSAIILNSIVIDAFVEQENKLFVEISFLYSIGTAILSLLFYYHLKSAKKAEHERDIIDKLWDEDRKHYELAKENIDLINMKCHDLKHQIHNIGKNETLDNKYIKSIEESIMIYDSVIKTGNNALDVSIAEKALICNKNNISLTCMIDGAKLNFIDDSDIYALFGNALDNAIEYLTNFVENEKRFIRIKSKEQNGLYILRVENYLKDKIELENGLPKTIKIDKNFHGFGVKSIKTIVESYKGEFFITQEDNLFSINMIFELH